MSPKRSGHWRAPTSKAKGMSMRSPLPLGYDLPPAGSRVLVVNEAEAQTVRTIFSSHLELGSVHDLPRWLDTRGIHSKRRMTRGGRMIGGQPFGGGALLSA